MHGLVVESPSRSIRAIVFDFDGVIVRRSEIFKQEAWGALFGGHENAWKSFKEAEARFGNGRGGDRFDILQFVFAALFPEETEEKREKRVADAAEDYDAIVQKKITNEFIDPIDRALLEQLSRKYPLYINSATPTEALIRTVQSLGISPFFTGVYGRPHSKVENFAVICTELNASPEEIIFIGDSESDYSAAQAAGCRFVGFQNEWNGWREVAKPFTVIQSLEEVEKLIS